MAEGKPKLESEIKLWEPVSNSAAEAVESCDSNKGMARYTTWKELLFGNTELESNWKYNKARVAMDARLQRLDLVLRMEQGYF